MNSPSRTKSQFSVPAPLPEALTYSGKDYTLGEQGAANVQVEGASGNQTGSVNYHRYKAMAARVSGSKIGAPKSACRQETWLTRSK